MYNKDFKKRGHQNSGGEGCNKYFKREQSNILKHTVFNVNF